MSNKINIGAKSLRFVATTQGSAGFAAAGIKLDRYNLMATDGFHLGHATGAIRGAVVADKYPDGLVIHGVPLSLPNVYLDDVCTIELEALDTVQTGDTLTGVLKWPNGKEYPITARVGSEAFPDTDIVIPTETEPRMVTSVPVNFERVARPVARLNDPKGKAESEDYSAVVGGIFGFKGKDWTPNYVARYQNRTYVCATLRERGNINELAKVTN